MRRLMTYCLLASAAACAPGDDDALAEETLPLAAFSALVVDAPVAVRLDTGRIALAEVSGAAAEVEALRAEVVDGTLSIGLDDAAAWRNPGRAPLVLRLVAPALASVHLEDGARLSTVAPLVARELEVVFRGRSNEADLELDGGRLRYYCNSITAGLLRLRGRAAEIHLQNFGFVSVDARDLGARVAHVANASAARVRVTVTDSLRYDITGGGDVELYGRPRVVVEGVVSGAGRLVRP